MGSFEFFNFELFCLFCLVCCFSSLLLAWWFSLLLEDLVEFFLAFWSSSCAS
jgi:hypothetical protein